MISQKARNIAAYTPGQYLGGGCGFVKLNTNENPYPPTPLASVTAGDLASLRLYSDPYSTELKTAIAEYHGITPENVFVGNGSDEVLAIICQTLFDPGATVASLDITYSFYPVYAQMYGFNLKTVPLKKDFTVDVSALAKTESNGVIFANPNAPTGTALDLVDIKRILAADINRPVVVDEAYVDFGAESADIFLHKYGNLVVTRTLSKSYSLAGARIGYALASKEITAALERIKNCFNSYTTDSLAQKIAALAVRDVSHMKKNAQKIIAARERFTGNLKALGFTVLPSKANFVFASHNKKSAKDIFEYLKARKILVRYFNAPRIDNHLRITIGTDEDMDKVIGALKNF